MKSYDFKRGERVTYDGLSAKVIQDYGIDQVMIRISDTQEMKVVEANELRKTLLAYLHYGIDKQAYKLMKEYTAKRIVVLFARIIFYMMLVIVALAIGLLI